MIENVHQIVLSILTGLDLSTSLSTMASARLYYIAPSKLHTKRAQQGSPVWIEGKIDANGPEHRPIFNCTYTEDSHVKTLPRNAQLSKSS